MPSPTGYGQQPPGYGLDPYGDPPELPVPPYRGTGLVTYSATGSGATATPTTSGEGEITQ